jgi:N-acetylmuramoyl-L-alanine amidase
VRGVPRSQTSKHRLAALGIWLPEISGIYDDATVHAVTAFEKVNNLDRDGLACTHDQEVLRTATRPEARSTAGHVVEVDIARQVLLIVHDGVVDAVLDTSTGARAGSTPTGTFIVHRQIDGMRISELGSLYRPKYIVGGIAFHGYPEVPPQPASHGCVRLTYAAMDAV